MKKFIIFLFAAVLTVGMVSAQERNERQKVNPRLPQNVEGTLKIEKGLIAVKSGESVYYVPMLTRYIGFINGLKEDSKVFIEGFIFKNIIHPLKVTVADKSYDFAMPRSRFGMQNNNFRFMRNPYQRNVPRHKVMPGINRNNERQNRSKRTEQG
jgi:hypothetical protein